MAMNDWNQDGKNDWNDDFLEYHYMYDEPEKKSKMSNEDLATTVSVVFIVIVTILIITFFLRMFT